MFLKQLTEKKRVFSLISINSYDMIWENTFFTRRSFVLIVWGARGRKSIEYQS